MRAPDNLSLSVNNTSSHQKTLHVHYCSWTEKAIKPGRRHHRLNLLDIALGCAENTFAQFCSFGLFIFLREASSGGEVSSPRWEYPKNVSSFRVTFLSTRKVWRWYASTLYENFVAGRNGTGIYFQEMLVSDRCLIGPVSLLLPNTVFSDNFGPYSIRSGRLPSTSPYRIFEDDYEYVFVLDIMYSESSFERRPTTCLSVKRSNFAHIIPIIPAAGIMRPTPALIVVSYRGVHKRLPFPTLRQFPFDRSYPLRMTNHSVTNIITPQQVAVRFSQQSNFVNRFEAD